MKQKLLKPAALLCLVVSLLLMTLAKGVALHFAPSPTQTVVRLYPYYSPMVFGYGNWLPLGTLVLAAVAAVLVCVGFWHHTKAAAMVCLGAAVAAQLLSWLLFGSFSTTGLLVAVLHVAALLLQWAEKASPYRVHK